MLIYVLIIVAGVILDQLSKAIVVANLSGQATLPIIPNVLHLTYMENTGAAFSLLSNSHVFLVIITIIFICLIGYLFFLLPKTKPFALANLGFSLILSGAIGNLIDRVRLSYVVDFVDFRLINFAVFNLADTFIVCGAIILVIAFVRNKQLINLDLNPVQHREFESEDQAEDVKPIHKNVLKDLLPHKSRDITPEVKTTLIKLPNHGPENVTSSSSFTTYEPNSLASSNMNGPISLERETKIYEEKIRIHNQNRYSKQSDHYEQFIKGQLEREKQQRGSTTRYYNKLDDYEESVKKQTPNRPVVREEKEHVWDPGEFKPITEKKRYSFDWNPEISVKEREKKSYNNQIENYQNSVKRQTGTKRNKSADKAYETEEVSKIKTRYDSSTESYLESIKAASKKTYTNNQ